MAREPDSSDQPRPRCPRCGYDLAGEVARWTTSCPLAGRCSECGLDLDWPRVVAVAGHPWLFEYHWRHRPLRRLVRTWLETLRPVRFWRDVHLTDPVRPGPLLAVVGAALLLLLLALVAALTVDAILGARGLGGTRGPVPRRDIGATAWHATRDIATIVALYVPAPVVVLAAMPVAFVMLPATLRRARVRAGHVWRIWMYSLFAPLTAGIAWALVLLAGSAFGLDWLVEAANPWNWVRPSRFFRPRFNSFWAFNRNILPGLLLAIPVLAWMALWWWRACRDYLELPRNGWITLALCVTVGLAAAAAQWWVFLSIT